MQVRTRGRFAGAAVTIGLLAGIFAGSAGAATQLGQTSSIGFGGCTAGFFNTVQVSVTSDTPYEVPSGGGVITQWRHWAADTSVGSGRLHVWEQVSGSNYRLIGRSDLQAFTPSVENVFATRIPVSAGQKLGFRTNTNDCLIGGASSGEIALEFPPNADPEPGEVRALPGDDGRRLNVAATLEADADNDGFGDETQDGCPGQPGPVNGCPEPTDTSSPQAQITKGPKNKTKKKKAKFEFTGTDARAIASFQCSLDGGAFAACTSPHTVKVKKGKHTFEVQAVDDAGNVGSPDSDRWKRKKKRK